MTQAHDPIEVHFHVEGRSTYPVPPLDPEWEPLDKLRWKAGVTHARTGLLFRIVTGVVDDAPDLYGYSGDGQSGGAYDYHDMWTWFNGVDTGAELARKEA